MELALQIIVGTIVGICTLGLLIFILKHIFNRIDTKVDKTAYDEHCKRIDEHLELGRKNFGEIKQTQNDMHGLITELCVSVKGIETGLNGK